MFLPTKQKQVDLKPPRVSMNPGDGPFFRAAESEKKKAQGDSQVDQVVDLSKDLFMIFHIFLNYPP